MPRRSPSPVQIRSYGALMVRNRMRGFFAAPPLPELRTPDGNETPLSAAEVRFAIQEGIAAPATHHEKLRGLHPRPESLQPGVPAMWAPVHRSGAGHQLGRGTEAGLAAHDPGRLEGPRPQRGRSAAKGRAQ